MTLAELKDKYGYSEVSWTTKFKRTSDAVYKNTGIRIAKEKKGKDINYYEEMENDNRAITMFKEDTKHELIMNEVIIGRSSWEFVTFIALVSTPMMNFYGRYEDLLKYMEIKDLSSSTIDLLSKSLLELEKAGFIQINEDRTDSNYKIITINQKTRREMKLNVEMSVDCKKLAEKNKMQDWTPLLKTWVALNFVADKSPIPISKICEMTGVSRYLLNKSISILMESNVFQTTKAYKNICGQTFYAGIDITRGNEAFFELPSRTGLKSK